MSMFLMNMTLLFGSSLVFYSISPYFSALGLVMVSMSSCFLLSKMGISFLALILLLVYMGGMLMVFIYSSAMTKDRFPTMSKMKEMTILSMIFLFWKVLLINKNKWQKISINKNLSSSVSIEGSSYIFHYSMAPFFILSGFILLISLLAVLNISRGNDNISLRAL